MAEVRTGWGCLGLCAVLLWGGCSPGMSHQEEQAASTGQSLSTRETSFVLPPLQTTVAQYTIEIDPKLLEKFERDEDTPEQPAVFITPDGQRRAIQMRLRGNSSRGWPKKSWRLELPEGEKFDGRRKFNLLSEWRDSTLMFEKLGYDLLAAMNVTAPRATYVRLVINGRFQGVYLDLERVDKPFLENHGFAKDVGTVYRCGGKNCEMKTSYDKDYQRDWEVSSPDDGPEEPMRQFLERVNHTPEPAFVQVMSEHFELEQHLRQLAMDALMSNDTVEDSRSYLLHDGVGGRMTYVPWDLNNTSSVYVPSNPPTGKRKDADFEHALLDFTVFDPIVEEEYLKRVDKEPRRGWKPIFSNLNTRIFLNPELRDRQLALIEKALDELFAPALIHARIDAIHTLLQPYVLDSPSHTDRVQFNDGPRYMKKYVERRSGFLRQELARWRAWKPTLVLQAVHPRQGWIELRNLGTAPLSTSGLVLTTDLRNAKKRNVPSVTLQPGQTVRFTQSQLGVKLAPQGEVGLFTGKSVVGVIDALYYGALPSEQWYQRDPATPTRWQVR
jgi:spore coat protein H